MNNPIGIRCAVCADLDALCGIEQGCFADQGDAFSRRVLRYLICKARGACYVACDGEQIVGYISLLTRRGVRNVRIYSVAVAAQARGCGVGQALVAEAIAYAQRGEFAEVTLEVRADNASAIALYARNGFAPDQLLRGYYHDRSDGQRMKKVLK